MYANRYSKKSIFEINEKKIRKKQQSKDEKIFKKIYAFTVDISELKKIVKKMLTFNGC